jgi:transcriptional regulator NrdR family protein
MKITYNVKKMMEISMGTKCKNCVKTFTDFENLKNFLNIVIVTHPNY